MGEKHIIKTVPPSQWRVIVKVMKQSKQQLNKLPRRKEGRHFLAIPHNVDTGLYLHSL